MKAGIVGLPNVGKSTLFNCLSNAKAQSANFPFCTIEPNLGVVNVPDARLEKLEELVHPERVQPATVEIVDIAGLVKGASKGEGLGNQFLGNIRECHAIIHVLRCFDNDNIVHVEGSVDPIRDKETIDIELQLKDLETVEKRLEKVTRAAKAGDKVAQKELALLGRYREALLKGISARAVELSEEEQELSQSYQLLTAKPILYVCNVDEASAASGNKYVEAVREAVKNENAQVIVLAVATEADIAELETYEERQLFLQDMGLDEPGASVLIRAAYKLLSLQTYFTATDILHRRSEGGTRLDYSGRSDRSAGRRGDTLRLRAWVYPCRSDCLRGFYLLWQRKQSERSRQDACRRERVYSKGWRYHAL